MNKILRYALLLMVAVAILYSASHFQQAFAPPRDYALATKATTEAEIQAELKALKPEAIDALMAREKQAVADNPVDAKSLLNLVVLYELKGDKAKQEALALALSDYSRRSIASQLSAIQIHLNKQEFDEAFQRLDGVLRARPELSGQILPTVGQLLLQPKPRAAIGKILAAAPPWRYLAFDYFIKGDATGTLAYHMLSGIRNAGGQPSSSELYTIISLMLKNNRNDQAYFIWLDFLSKDELVKLRNLYDGGFDRDARNLYFGWNVPQRKNARIAIQNRAGSSTDRALVLDLANDADPSQFAFQYLKLAPGAYKVTYEAAADDLQTTKGLAWKLYCVESRTAIAQATPVTESGPWEKRAFDVTVPAENCQTQSLRLEHVSFAKLDLKISGRLSFDNFDIQPASAEGTEDGQ